MNAAQDCTTIFDKRFLGYSNIGQNNTASCPSNIGQNNPALIYCLNVIALNLDYFIRVEGSISLKGVSIQRCHWCRLQFIEDNARPHRNLAVEELLES